MYSTVTPNPVCTWLPNVPRPQLELDAITSAAAIYGGEVWRDSVPRVTVNYLRHTFTDYDDQYSPDRHRDVLVAIGREYPWLQGECARQITKRRELVAA